MERIWGPVNGFWLAAYAAPVGDGDRYAGYAKVCWTRPESYWEGDCAFKVFGGEYHRNEEEALASAALDAQTEISCLPRHARALADKRQRDQVPIPRLFITSFFRHRMA